MAPVYSPLRNDSEEDVEKNAMDQESKSLLFEDTLPDFPDYRTSRPWKQFVFLTALVVLHSLSFAAGAWWKGKSIKTLCFQKSFLPSPLKNAMKPDLVLTRFNGTLDWGSPYRGSPSEDIDAAWNIISRIGMLSISEEEVISLGASTDAIRLPESFGGGYMAQSELSHQMHCLNLLRKSLFINYDYYENQTISFHEESASTVRYHLEHCVEILRQDIMCHADPGVYTSHWLEDYPRPYPNFNVFKMCRSWEDVVDWAKERAVEYPKHWSEIMLPNAVKLSAPPRPGDFVEFPPLP